MLPSRPLCTFAAALLSIGPGTAASQSAVPAPAGGVLDALVRARDSRIAHYSSHDPRLANDDFRRLAPGDTLTLMDHRGAGILRRWWLTIAPRDAAAIQRQLIVRAYWDDEATPSVEVPVSDFFGVGFGAWTEYVSAPSRMTSGGYDSDWAMPFRRRGRITVENRSRLTIDRPYYHLDVEAVERLPDDAFHFHARFCRASTRRGDDGRVGVPFAARRTGLERGGSHAPPRPSSPRGSRNA